MKPLPLILLCSLCSLLAAQDNKPKTADASGAVKQQSAAPVLPAELRAKFWKAAAEINAYEAQHEKLQNAVVSARAELAKSCESQGAMLDVDATGDAICKVKPVPKPEEKKPEAAKPAK